MNTSFVDQQQAQKIEQQFKKAKKLLLSKNVALIAHYFVDGSIQDLAEDTGGFVGDSLEMAKFGASSDADILIVAGVHFMGETTKILSPNKTILMPTLEATCSLVTSCDINEFKHFKAQYPDHTVVVYANTSVEVKAEADWVATSSIAIPLIEHLQETNQKILWAPDKYLGSYLKKTTGADMVIWQGACIVHEEFKAKAIKDLKKHYPDAAILVHPESPAEVIEMADFIGSSSQMIKAAQSLNNKAFILASDAGLRHKLEQLMPEKLFIEAAQGGTSATCRSCSRCPWMGMNNLERLINSLEHGRNEITLNEEIRQKAFIPLQKMIDFSDSLKSSC